MSFIAKINSTDYTDREIVAGSSNVIVTNGAGVAGNPTVDINTSGLSPSFAKLTFTLTSTFYNYYYMGATTNSWVTVPMNQIRTDPDSIVSLSSNEFTLDQGNYVLTLNVNGYSTQGCNMYNRIYNVTDSVAETGISQALLATASGGSSTIANFTQLLTPSSTKTYRLEYQMASGVYAQFYLGSLYGYGPSSSMDIDFASISILKI